jgi:hypothetical protein
VQKGKNAMPIVLIIPIVFVFVLIIGFVSVVTGVAAETILKYVVISVIALGGFGICFLLIMLFITNRKERKSKCISSGVSGESNPERTCLNTPAWVTRGANTPTVEDDRGMHGSDSSSNDSDSDNDSSDSSKESSGYDSSVSWSD